MVKIVDAKSLRKNEIYCSYLDPFIEEQKVSINCSINDAHDAGVNTVEHEIPSTLPIPDTFKLKKAQKYVCFKLITDIEAAGHTTELDLSNDKIILIIKWKSKDSKEYQDEIDTVLANRIKKITTSESKKTAKLPIFRRDSRMSRLEREDREFYLDNVLNKH